MIGFLLGTSTGRTILLMLAGVLAVGVVVLLIYRQGEAAALAGAAAAALERTAAAARARAKVKPNDQGAMDADPYNRDRG